MLHQATTDAVLQKQQIERESIIASSANPLPEFATGNELNMFVPSEVINYYDVASSADDTLKQAIA